MSSGSRLSSVRIARACTLSSMYYPINDIPYTNFIHRVVRTSFTIDAGGDNYDALLIMWEVLEDDFLS